MTSAAVIAPEGIINKAERSQDWTNGRLVVQRPDVPGVRCEPMHQFPVRSDDERVALGVALDALSAQIQSRQGEPPEWLAHADDVLSTAVDGSSDLPNGQHAQPTGE
jgi:hypothetical protein